MKCPKGCEMKDTRKEIVKHLEDCKHDSDILLVTPSGKIMTSKDEYWWSEQKFKLPIEFSFDV